MARTWSMSCTSYWFLNMIRCVWKLWIGRSVHTTPVKFENAVFYLPLFRPTVHTNPPQKGALNSKTLFKPKEFENDHFVSVLVWTGKIFEVGAFPKPFFLKHKSKMPMQCLLRFQVSPARCIFYDRLFYTTDYGEYKNWNVNFQWRKEFFFLANWSRLCFDLLDMIVKKIAQIKLPGLWFAVVCH